jgi:SAM-dependent methyltransferase
MLDFARPIAFLTRRSPVARRNGMHELLDGDRFTPEELSGNLREIRMINRGLGWTTSTLRLIERVAQTQALTTFSYLDVATGSADLPLAFLKRAARRGWSIDAHALDYNPAVLDQARRFLGDAPVTLHAGDARSLPFPDHSFDIVTFALALHHFPPDEAVSLLRELGRVARRAWVLVDVERAMIPYLGARWLRLLLRNRLTRHDAPATVLRAYTQAELRGLLARAGLPDAVSARQFPFRLVAIGLVASVQGGSPCAGLSQAGQGSP